VISAKNNEVFSTATCIAVDKNDLIEAENGGAGRNWWQNLSIWGVWELWLLTHSWKIGKLT
jgi:hypothetical protein